MKNSGSGLVDHELIKNTDNMTDEEFNKALDAVRARPVTISGELAHKIQTHLWTASIGNHRTTQDIMKEAMLLFRELEESIKKCQENESL